MSAHTPIEGQFDFKKTPLTPRGINVIVQEKPKQHETWVIHGLPGWYIGPAMDH